MEPELLRSRDLLKSAGLTVNPEVGVPLAHRHLLITSVLDFVTSSEMAKFLRENGHKVSSKTASDWQQSTREWLGLPLAGRGKPSAEYRKTVEEWRRADGNPTPEEIDAGWVPVHRRSPQKEHQTPDTTSPPAAESALDLPKGNHSFLKFLAHDPSDVTGSALIASALDLFGGSKDSLLTRRYRATGEVFEKAGVKIDQSVAPGQWILPAAELAILSDLELTLIAYLLSDLPGPPNHGTGTEYKNWLHELLRVAASLKAKIMAGVDFTFREIYP